MGDLEKLLAELTGRLAVVETATALALAQNLRGLNDPRTITDSVRSALDLKINELTDEDQREAGRAAAYETVREMRDVHRLSDEEGES